MKVVKMCPKCNPDHIDAFEEMVRKEPEKFEFKRGCSGNCNNNKPSCKVDKKKYNAESVDDLFAQINK